MVNNTPRKKRHFCRNIIIVMAFAVLLAGGAFAAARNAHAKAHTHSYRWVTKKNATCKETGYRNYECACGSILNSQTIDKTPHTWNRGSANCTTAKKCTYCGYVAQAAKGHQLTWVTKKAASCTETGYRNYECHCGYVQSSATIDKTPHNWNRGSADCTNAKVCRDCGTVGEAAKGHRTTWVTKKAASCTETGYRNLECPCGYVQSSATIDKTPHNWNRGSADCTNDKVCRDCGTVGEAAKGHSYSWVVKTPASCTDDGLKEHRCACGAVDETKVIDKWGHHYDIPSASCTEDQKCTTCGDIKEYAKGHNWDRPAATCTLPKKCLRCGKIGEKATGQHVGTQWVVVVEPTCHSGGVEEWRCDCGHSLDGRDIPSNNNHNWVVDHTEPGNCVAWGSTYYRCTNDGCKQTKREANIPPTGHANRRWVVTKEPTKTADGVESYICEYCDDVSETRTLYLISYAGNGGKNIPGNQYKSAGVDITLSSATPTRDGYDFKGWGITKSQADYQPGAKYSADARLTLIAVWKEKKFKVSYNLKGGTVSQPDLFEAKTYKYSASVYVNTEAPQKPGYIFKGWDTASAATTVVYHPGDQYKAKKTVILYAVWQAEEYTVDIWDYDANGRLDWVRTETVTYGQKYTCPKPEYYLPGNIFRGWSIGNTILAVNTMIVDKQPGDEIVITGDLVLCASADSGNDMSEVAHDFSGYVETIGLRDDAFVVTENGGTYGANQGYYSNWAKYSRARELLWALYQIKNPNVETNLLRDILQDSELIDTLKKVRGVSGYEEIRDLLMEYYHYEIPLNSGEIPHNLQLTSPGAFTVIRDNLGDTVVSMLKAHYEEKVQDLFSGSCGMFAAINTYLYLSGNRNCTDQFIHDTLLEYFSMTDGGLDWLERYVSGGDGPASIRNFLQGKFSNRNCNATWCVFASDLLNADFEAEIGALLLKDIPVILAYNRCDGTYLNMYWYRTKDGKPEVYCRNGDDWRIGSHYVVVTGIYKKPGSDKVFLEISTWGQKAYICLQEYLYGRGVSAFSTYMNLEFK